MTKVGRNDKCPCGSGKKYKHCHGRSASIVAAAQSAIQFSEKNKTIPSLPVPLKSSIIHQDQLTSEDKHSNAGPKLVQSVTVHFRSEQTFEQMAKNPEEWHRVALNLKTSSDILLPASTYHDTMKAAIMSGFAKEAVEELNRTFKSYTQTSLVSLMLLGMAFECLLKGLILFADPSLVSTSKLDKKIGTHNLEALAKRLASSGGIILSSSEVSMIHPLLSDLIIWGGRYPIPRQQNEMLDRFSHSSREIQEISALWNKLTSELQSKYIPPVLDTPT